MLESRKFAMIKRESELLKKYVFELKRRAIPEYKGVSAF